MNADPAQRLREAAAIVRKHASAATPGPWRSHDTHLGRYGYTATVLSGEGNSADLRAWLPSMSQEPWDEARNVWADAAWIALVGPVVGEALAAVLDQAADKIAAAHKAAAHIWDADDPEHQADAEEFIAQRIKSLAPALALADAILGEVTR